MARISAKSISAVYLMVVKASLAQLLQSRPGCNQQMTCEKKTQWQRNIKRQGFHATISKLATASERMAHESPQKVSQQFIWWLSKHPWRSFCKKDQDLINRLHVKRKPNDTEISNGKDFMLQSPNWQQPQSEWLTNLRKKYLSSLFDGCQSILGAVSAKQTRM